MAPAEADDGWLEWDDTGHNETGSSRINLRTPSTSTGDTSDENFIEDSPTQGMHYQSGPGFDSVCPHWQQHLAHENLWSHCPRCKRYILKMSARRVTS